METDTTKSGFDLRERPEVKLMNTSRKKTWTCRSSAAQAAQLQAEEIQPIPVGKRVYLAELEAESDALVDGIRCLHHQVHDLFAFR